MYDPVKHLTQSSSAFFQRGVFIGMIFDGDELHHLNRLSLNRVAVREIDELDSI